MPSIFDTIAIVHWLDAASHDAWGEVEERKNDGLVSIISIGFILSEDEQAIKIVRSSQVNESSNEGMFAIPKGMITKIDYLPSPLKKKRKPRRKPTNETPV